MHALFISPPVQVAEEYEESIRPHMPLGIAYLAGAIANVEHKVTVIDAFVEGFDEIFLDAGKTLRGLDYKRICIRISQINPDVILLSIPFSLQASPVIRLAKICKMQFPKKTIIIGGPHVSVAYNSLALHNFIDIIVRGEGELVLIKILERMERRQKLTGIPGIIYRDTHGCLHDNGAPELINDLDQLPFPLWNVFNHKRIHELRGEKSITMITSRGCPYSCCFCSIQQVMGRKYRARSPKNVIKEIDRVVFELGIKTIYFEDDNLTLDKDRAKTLFQLMIDRNYGICWLPRNGVRMDSLDSEMLQLMKASGCGRVWIAPESGSEKILQDVINKKIDIDRVYAIAEMIISSGLPVTCFFVIGFPQETRVDLSKTIDMAIRLKKIGVDDFWFSCAVPYLGTRLFKMCKSLQPQIEWTNQVESFSTHLGLISTHEFSNSDIQRLRKSAMQLLNQKKRDSVKITAEDIFNHAYL